MATEATLQAILGGKAAARTLLFLENYGEGYARQIAKTFEMPVSEVQKQLNKFEEVGVLVSRPVGNARVYSWNPRDKALANLRALLSETLANGMPEERLKRYYRDRHRPRRKGKQ